MRVSKVARADLAGDLASAIAGWLVALLLLRYLHDAWQPGWALACGLLAGIVLRRLVRPNYASFPLYVRRPLGVGVVLLGTIVASWATLAREPWSYWLLRWREAVTLPLLAGFLGLAIAGVIYSHARMRREIEESRTREAALREATLRARLRALQAQINPHFLFNALNALAELTHDDPHVAEQLVGDLGHLLRYGLRSSARRTVPLGQELEAVDRYVRIEAARLGDRLRVVRRIDPDVRHVQVPGLVLQPLVENAVQHAVASRTQGGTVEITVRRRGGRVDIRVRDDGPGLPEHVIAALSSPGERPEALEAPSAAAGTEGAGGGLINVVRRLALTYRGEATFTVTAADPGTEIEVTIPT